MRNQLRRRDPQTRRIQADINEINHSTVEPSNHFRKPEPFPLISAIMTAVGLVGIFHAISQAVK